MSTESRSDQVSNDRMDDSAVDSREVLRRLSELTGQLKSLEDQLTESQRLATIGTLTAVIAHEFNNLLTPVISYAQVALKTAESETPDRELIVKALSKTINGAGKAAKICASLLGLARGESGFERVLVGSLVEQTLGVLARDPSKDGIAVRVQVQPGLTLLGDEVQLSQVLLNLLINARQAMLGTGRGGSITIRAAADESAGQVCLQVSDSGPGIPASAIGRVFEPFFTTKGTARRGQPRGTGLGLAICKRIVEHHRGTIEVSSTPGQGATFTVRLPMG